MYILSAIISIGATIMVYAAFSVLYKKKPLTFMHPNIMSMLVIILFLYFFKIPYSLYETGGKIITSFLGICIVILGVPLYESFVVLLKNFKIIIFTSLLSIYVSFVALFIFSKLFKLPQEIFLSLVPKSITTPMAMEASTLLGGLTSLSVFSVIITGILGAVFGESLLKIFKSSSPLISGSALGMSSHVLGTTKALELGMDTGAISAICIPVTGVLTLINIPLFLFLTNIFY